MSKNQRITGSLMIIIGIVIFGGIMVRFYLQGYFTKSQNFFSFYGEYFDMGEMFGTLVFSLLFAISGYFLIAKKIKLNYSMFLCQFSIIGFIIDRIWYVYENIGSIEITSYDLPFFICFFFILYWVLIYFDFNYKLFLKRILIIIFCNISIISIGKYLLPSGLDMIINDSFEIIKDSDMISDYEVDYQIYDTLEIKLDSLFFK